MAVVIKEKTEGLLPAAFELRHTDYHVDKIRMKFLHNTTKIFKTALSNRGTNIPITFDRR